MTHTLFGFRHYVIAVVLTLVMALVVVLFVADMATVGTARLAKAIDAIIGIGWAALVGFLVSNSWHAAVWAQQISN